MGGTQMIKFFRSKKIERLEARIEALELKCDAYKTQRNFYKKQYEKLYLRNCDLTAEIANKLNDVCEVQYGNQ